LCGVREQDVWRQVMISSGGPNNDGISQTEMLDISERDVKKLLSDGVTRVLTLMGSQNSVLSYLARTADTHYDPGFRCCKVQLEQKL
jgi:hypothetical protein